MMRTSRRRGGYQGGSAAWVLQSSGLLPTLVLIVPASQGAR